MEPLQTSDHNTVALIITFSLFFIGFAGSFLPLVPGCFLIWLGIFIHKIWMGDASISWCFFWIATGLTLFTQIMDYAFAYWGARKFGASWRGGVGALAGLFIFPFLLTPFIGMLVGPFLGAVAGELTAGRELREASRAGMGTVVGGILAFALKFGTGVFMISWFCFRIFQLGQ